MKEGKETVNEPEEQGTETEIEGKPIHVTRIEYISKVYPRNLFIKMTFSSRVPFYHFVTPP